jgi:hypothetical protein
MAESGVQFLMPEKRLNRLVSRMEGVRMKVRQKGAEIQVKAMIRLAPHRRTGQAHIDFHMGRTDALISLVDEGTDSAVLSIEYGHYAGRRGLTHSRTWVEGIHVFRGYRNRDF